MTKNYFITYFYKNFIRLYILLVSLIIKIHNKRTITEGILNVQRNVQAIDEAKYFFTTLLDFFSFMLIYKDFLNSKYSLSYSWLKSKSTTSSLWEEKTKTTNKIIIQFTFSFLSKYIDFQCIIHKILLLETVKFLNLLSFVFYIIQFHFIFMFLIHFYIFFLILQGSFPKYCRSLF